MTVATDFTSSVPVPSITAAGCSIPTFEAIRAGLIADFFSAYGIDVSLDNSDQDAQWLGILSKALFNYCTAFLGAYNAFSPATAQGTGLSSVVKVNGIERLVASTSTVDIVNIGQAGSIITDPTIRDPANNLWVMPDFTIPLSGTITVTATCTVLGAIAAPVGTFTSTSIANPQRGWQSVTNLVDAAPGAPIEKDAALRVRQSQSTALPSRTILDGIVGALLMIPGVSRLRAYENDGIVPDANGIPGGAISIVIDGGDAALIAQTILNKKVPGGGTYGSSTSPTPPLDAYGIPRPVFFFRPTEPRITYLITITKLLGYSGDVPVAIAQSVSDWTNALGIFANGSGQIRLTRVFGPSLLPGSALGSTFEILSIMVARDGNPLSAVDIPISFNEAPLCDPSAVMVVPQ